MASESTPSPETTSKTGTGCLRVFFLLFFAAGCFAFFVMGIQPAWRIYQASGWQEVPCQILSSQVRINPDSDGDTYSVAIRFRYRFDGAIMESERYSFVTTSSSGRKAKQSVVNRYPPGAESVCYVNPANPQEAVLVRTAVTEMWWCLFAIPFVAVGLLGFIYAPRLASPRTSVTGPIASTGPAKVGQIVTSDAPVSGGPATLRSSSSRVGRLIGAIVVCLFWNGIISVFLYQIWKGFHRGSPEWILTIFMLPFVLVGLALIGGVFHTVLGLFNPRVELQLNPGAAPLGSLIGLAWNFSGRTTRIRKLQILIEALERATYRRGTDTVTDESVFWRSTVIETINQSEMRSGTARIQIPANLIHSFKARNNEIVWRVKVQADIPRFPNVSEEFKFDVLPRGAIKV